MSIDTIERYLQELEAIKNYRQVKQEKEELSHKIEELKVSLDNALEEVSSLKSSKANLDGAEMTLEQARLDFIRAQDAEIEKRAADRFKKLKADYESRMPQLVYQRLREILREPWLPEEIAKLIDTEAKKKADAVLRDPDNWPPWFKELYQQEINKKVSAGLNQEFNARVETAAVARARQRLNELTSTEWPAWYQANVDPRIIELETKINTGALQLLIGPWGFTCDRCGTSSNAELTAGEIEQLLRTGQIKVACANPDCEDHSLFSTRRHTFQVSLYNLIEVRIAG
jgi:DNA repair exonuclease SbcCD ATPase subunit